MEEKKVKALFLITDDFDNTSQSLKLIKKFHKKNDNSVIISLSFLAKYFMKDQHITCKTPNMYQNMLFCDQLDNTAIKYAKKWYKSIENDLDFKGISLGQMLEYDSYYLFVDALRSIIIADEIISSELPSIIYMPDRMILNEPNVMCYETLPQVVCYLASKKDIPVVKIKPSLKSDLQDQANSLIYDIKYLCMNYVKSIANIYRIYSLKCSKNAQENMIMFCQVYSFNSICKELTKNNFNCINLLPMTISTSDARKKIVELRNLSREMERNNFQDINLIFKDVPLSLILDYRFKNNLRIKLPELIGNIEWADKITRKIRPVMLVAMEDVTPLKRMLCKLFSLKGLPSLVIQHGILGYDMAGFHVMPVEAKKQAVWGNASSKWHLGRGKTETSQIITGNHRFDQIICSFRKKLDKDKICKKLNLNANELIILVAIQRFAGITSKHTIESEELFIRGTLRSLKKFPYGQIVVKLHPSYPKRYYQMVSIISNEEDLRVMIIKDHLWDLLAVADVVITYASTVGLEAMLFDKPLIIINLENQEDMSGYVSNNAAIGVYREDDLVPAINEVLFSENIRKKLEYGRKKFIYEYAYLQDGNAHKRIANLIMQMIEENMQKL